MLKKSWVVAMGLALFLLPVIAQDEKDAKEKEREVLVKRLNELGIKVNKQPVMQAEVVTVALDTGRMVVKPVTAEKNMVLAINEKPVVKNKKKNMEIKELKRGDKVILLLDPKTMAINEIYLDRK
ncbi:MAG TPA: hypothetical protein VGL91_07055 [Acidobacteriota bacterium]|jgi:hypothetical protein